MKGRGRFTPFPLRYLTMVQTLTLRYRATCRVSRNSGRGMRAVILLVFEKVFELLRQRDDGQTRAFPVPCKLPKVGGPLIVPFFWAYESEL